MKRTLIVYDTKYGSTKLISQNLARVLGPSNFITPLEFCDCFYDFDFVVIGSPVYNEQILPSIRNFVLTNLDWLKSKKIALFAVGMHPSSEKSLVDIQNLLGDCVIWTGKFGGILNPSALDENDNQTMRRFSAYTGYPIAYTDCRNERTFAAESVALRRILYNTCSMPKDKLKKQLEDFLLSHNTCVLCTGHDGDVRATPIEYLYHNESFYFFSEGGEKAAHLLINSNVSIAVNDSYKGFQKLAGLQVTGKAEIVTFGSIEYMDAATAKGLNYENIKKLPVMMNLIKVKPVQYEFLYSELSKEGYAVKQAIKLPN